MIPTEAQLKAEPWWGRETEPVSIVALSVSLASHYKVPLTNFGIRGDIHHLKGYHRSREWCLKSAYCSERSYSTSRTAGDANGGVDTDCCALDIQVPQPELVAMCKRLDKAIRAGRLEKITEWYGTFGDDDRVDGYDNIANRVATSDPSHLWHLHLSFDRGRAREAHSDVFFVLTGGAPVARFTEDQRDDILWSIANREYAMLTGALVATYRTHDETADRHETNALQMQLDRIEHAISAPLDPVAIGAAIAATITSNPDALAPFLDAIRDEVKRNLDPDLISERTLQLLGSLMPVRGVGTP